MCLSRHLLGVVSVKQLRTWSLGSTSTLRGGENLMTIRVDNKDYPLEAAIETRPGWDVEINGEPVNDVRTLSAINHQMGIAFLYGRSPAGEYNQGRLVNRGGSVIVPTVVLDGVLYFLALSQIRTLISTEPILEFPRGQAISSGEAAIHTASREFWEETGLNLPEELLTYLGNGNPDSALIHGANVHAWWLRLPNHFVQMDDGMPKIRRDIEGKRESRVLENILDSRLVPENEFSSPSILTMWAMGLVLQRLRRIQASSTGAFSAV